MLTVPKNKFRVNQYGHRIIMLIGSNLNSAEEIRLFEITGCRVGDHARQMLGEKSYDEQRLHEGHLYEVVLLPCRCIPSGLDCTPVKLCKKARKMFGYGEPLAGIAPYICGAIEQMGEMNFGHIVIPHKPIRAADFLPYLLEVSICNKKPFLDSCPGHSHHQLDMGTMLAFFSGRP